MVQVYPERQWSRTPSIHTHAKCTTDLTPESESWRHAWLRKSWCKCTDQLILTSVSQWDPARRDRARLKLGLVIACNRWMCTEGADLSSTRDTCHLVTDPVTSINCKAAASCVTLVFVVVFFLLFLSTVSGAKEIVSTYRFQTQT